MSRIRVGIVGGSGYAAGELVRLLLFHPCVEIAQVASGSHSGQFVHNAHPNLRKVTQLRFTHPDDLGPCDLLFLALPHGASVAAIERYRGLAPRIVDLSADFRLRSPDLYRHWYGEEHPLPGLLSEAVYGLPELHREELADAWLVSGVGCNATAAILGLAPLYRAGLVDQSIPLVVESKIASSAAGATPGAGSHHPDRSGAVRSFQPTGHRHTAELIQELGAVAGEELCQKIAFSATAVEMVRGVLVTAHAFVRAVPDEKVLWRVYREAYGQEPFIRLVKERTGIYRYPEPKILSGSNFCDIGFELDVEQGRVVVISALDNLVKGAAGSAVQSMNCIYGWDETLGLSFPGLHPI
ncbi:MAG: N-acetyl-gamma-glutamyl-phosphate reductase [Chloroflexota bacterium]|nr:N-acetyl-gamma-glutamyl-phosphate reductase [Chloroflexota bacterium]